MNAVRVSDLTVDELMELVRTAVREVLAEETHLVRPPVPADQSGILAIPTVEIHPWPAGLETISRAEIYGDDER